MTDFGVESWRTSEFGRVIVGMHIALPATELSTPPDRLTKRRRIIDGNREIGQCEV